MKIVDGSGLEVDALVVRDGRNVKVSFASENTDLKLRFTLEAEGAAELARAILATVEEVHALPPDGWRRCTEKPKPGTRVRWFRSSSGPREDLVGVVSEDIAHHGTDRVCVRWDGLGTLGEPTWYWLLVEDT